MDAPFLSPNKASWNVTGRTDTAALLSKAYRPQPGERVGVLLCGANVELIQARGALLTDVLP